MQRAEKQAEIDGLRDRFDRMISAVFVDYKGLNVADVTLVLSFEMRGSAGPSIMFETGADGGWVIREYAAFAPDPSAATSASVSRSGTCIAEPACTTTSSA